MQTSPENFVGKRSKKHRPRSPENRSEIFRGDLKRSNGGEHAIGDDGPEAKERMRFRGKQGRNGTFWRN